MANLTLVIDDDLLRAARIKVVQQGTSVNEICREAIARFAVSAVDQHDVVAQLRALAARKRVAQADGAAAARLPSRSEMMEDAMQDRMPTLMAALARK